MRVFVTGASGFIGSHLLPELIAAGHSVTGLARNDASASAIAALGATVHRGSLEDTQSICAGAAQADAVIHLAFNHDFSKFAENCETDRRTIEGLAATLRGSDRPLIVTSGLGVLAEGRAVTESDPAVPSSVIPRAISEETALAAAANGVRASVMRLPQVHDRSRAGLITWLIDIALEKGVSPYAGDGSGVFAAAHVSDVARLYRLVLEKGVAGKAYHAVAEEGVPLRAIAETIGTRFNLPVRSIDGDEIEAHFGWMARFANGLPKASSAWTRETLGWNPTGTGLLDDLAHAREAAAV
jgi:nucleoside-diphosphate-sugar epimerase